MRKAVILSLLPMLLLFGNVALAEDAPAEPAVAAAVEEAKPADAVQPKAADPVADADKKLEDAAKAVEEDPAAKVDAIVAAFQEGRWAAAIGLLVMFLIWVLRRFVWTLIPKNALPWVTLALGCAVTVAAELIAGVTWWKTLIDGFITGACAMGFWSSIFKHVLKPQEAEAEEEEATDPA